MLLTKLNEENKKLVTDCCVVCSIIQYGKVKVYPRKDHEGPDGEYRYSSVLSLTSRLDGVHGQRHTPAALPLGKTRYPLYRRLGGPQGRSGQVRKISPASGFDPWTVQPLASHYTDWAVWAQFSLVHYWKGQLPDRLTDLLIKRRN
jgi:hypothetical protein